MKESKNSNHTRLHYRKIEREIVQYKAKQELPENAESNVKALEEQDPAIFEELSLKRRWSSVCRDPERGLSAEHANTTLAQWPLINHMSPKQVQTIVTKKILKLD